jgi:hypothetical protein
MGIYYYLCTINHAKKETIMKKASKKQIANGRKVYMTITGVTFTPEKAKEYYGERFETAILAKAILNKDGDVIGSWE